MNAWRLAIVGSRHYPRPELAGTAHTIQVARLAGKMRRTYGPDGSEIEWHQALRAPADSGG